MKAILGFVMVTLLTLYGVIVLLYFRKLRMLLATIRECERKLWENLGSPTLFLNNSPRNSYALSKLLFTKQYMCAESEQVRCLGLSARRLLLAGLLVFPMLLLIPMVFSA